MEKFCNVPKQCINRKKGWWSRLKQGLRKSSDKLNDGLKHLFIKKKLDYATIEELEELLILSDIGVETAAKFAGNLAKEKLDKDVTIEEVKQFLSAQIEEELRPYAVPLEISQTHRPHVVLVIGVNGSGKTTTIGKLGKLWQDQGLKVQFVAGDTFRAAAVEQLQVWANRLSIPISTTHAGGDAAALAFDALESAKQNNCDVLIIDTAGRLHNKAGLMDELKKIVRVLKKVDADAPHDVLLVLDATTGQNAHLQTKTFKEMIGVTGLVLTKLDGTAKGGVVVSLTQKHDLPIHAIGVGETAEDLRPFTAKDFANTLVGLEAEEG
ncbi:signal recognition particle-docking protein FtsY [Candidatus Paracaedibacter symbiosus]|uniref:signal recognition particle-docking protein FtsY n=1 Tax=Candidatus Paracaedibacter symbiosus TaxID=244582 RepID=UPI000AB78BB4|nr:signal recognition particle-docking protein FtsY [Candidatus Paracaedibacter symbiosus]